MQTASYSVSSGNRIELWRGIPAEIEISGIENTSGDWLFLIDENWRDGSLLAGTVAASGENLIVTLEEMNTVELAKAISSHDSLLCRATLTDSTSRVYLIPLTIRNRAVEGAPPVPVAEYYTKAQIDALIAGITASDVGAVSIDGLELADLTSGVIPAPGKVYAFAPPEAAEMTFPEPVEGMTNAFRLRITMPDPAVAVTWPAGLVWRFAIPTLAAGTTSELAFAWNGRSWEGWATPDLADFALLSADNTFAGGVAIGTKIVQGAAVGSTRWNNTNNTGVCLNSASSAGSYSVAEGYACSANGLYSHAEGNSSTVAGGGYGSHVEGQENYVKHPYCHAEGHGTVTGEAYQHVAGVYNAETTGARVTGGGGSGARKNIEVLDWSGNLIISGDLTFTPAGAENSTTLSALIAGEEIVALTGTAITPAHAKVFQHTLAASEVFTIDTSSLTSTRQVTFEVHLIQPSTAVSFTLPSGILWEDDGAFAAANPAPDFSTGSTLYALVFRWNGSAILGNLAYTKAV